ncbi:YeaH/YhbH family protein [Halomonas sp. MCCC 1A17488]|uniref:YeaH/YhbH family protein n=1 Tax=unclassified Halomonas TaxID=2609666 RepID=UPI0018D26662|nr:MULTISPECIES: YeaH/YhbH family protein [unclassified Halomonas]MCE8016358.1 YeaH/YhbH family protein [Halomonas sp. MCCC 1A17488]MCG3239691.1 YeaH/YhbH family protein [Halomonas sp. MCCC 1A17488]QPP50400.1 YeaH/YhbH family protein [Halomonas sp. SS10-MC5]
MTYFIDRRANAKNKSAVNRQRFLDRYRTHIKRSVEEAVNRRSITDMERGEKVSIPTRDISEPVFQHGPGGKRTIVSPGNKEFVEGDRLRRPSGGGGGDGSGEGGASNQGEGMDEFAFSLTREEFLDFVFDGLELPHLERKALKDLDEVKPVRAGVTRDGVPARINIVRSMREAYARRIAMRAPLRRALRAAQEALDEEERKDPVLRNPSRIAELKAEIERLEKRLEAVPFIDTYDLRYNNLINQPQPSSKAVMFCVMDVSGSMTQAHKDIAKRFFLLLYLFLERNYEKVELVFVRHHTAAKEVDEEEFFYSRETGGTIVSSALTLVDEIITRRYPPTQWNLYVAQASDGDNWDDDSVNCRERLMKSLMPRLQYYTYVEITPHAHQALWEEYETVASEFPDRFAMRQIVEAGDIYPVFRELFKRRAAH